MMAPTPPMPMPVVATHCTSHKQATQPSPRQPLMQFMQTAQPVQRAKSVERQHTGQAFLQTEQGQQGVHGNDAAVTPGVPLVQVMQPRQRGRSVERQNMGPAFLQSEQGQQVPQALGMFMEPLTATKVFGEVTSENGQLAHEKLTAGIAVQGLTPGLRNYELQISQLQDQVSSISALCVDRSDQLRVQQKMINELREELAERTQVSQEMEKENTKLAATVQSQALRLSEIEPLAINADRFRIANEQLAAENKEQAARITELEPIAIIVGPVSEENTELKSKQKEQTQRIIDLERRVTELYNELYPPTPEELQPELKLEGDPIDNFIKDFFEEHADQKISVTKVKEGWYSLGPPISQKVHLKQAGTDVVVYRVGGLNQSFAKFLELARAEAKQMPQERRSLKSKSTSPRSGISSSERRSI